MTRRSIKKVAKCPHCKAPHDYVEVRFPVENDAGYWKIDCQACDKPFIVELENPRESTASYYVSERHEVAYDGPMDCIATEIVAHNLDLNQTAHRFNFDAAPIYLCQQTGYNRSRPHMVRRSPTPSRDARQTTSTWSFTSTFHATAMPRTPRRFSLGS
jgi:transposase-like protein